MKHNLKLSAILALMMLACACKSELDSKSEVDWFSSMRAAGFSPADRAGSGILTMIHVGTETNIEKINTSSPRSDNANFRLTTLASLESLQKDAQNDDFPPSGATIEDVLDMVVPDVVTVTINDSQAKHKIGVDVFDAVYRSLTGIVITDGVASSHVEVNEFPFLETITP